MRHPALRRAGIIGNAGLAFCIDCYAERISTKQGLPKPSYDIVGVRWSISDWLDRARSLDTDAIRLDSLIRTNISPADPLRAGFEGWLAAWRALYDAYVGPNAKSLSQANVSLNYDQFNAELSRRKAQFDSFAQDYNTAVTSGGRPTAIFQSSPEANPSNAQDGSGLPWWFWLGVIATAGVSGYFLYRRYVKGFRFSRDPEPSTSVDHDRHDGHDRRHNGHDDNEDMPHDDERDEEGVDADIDDYEVVG